MLSTADIGIDDTQILLSIADGSIDDILELLSTADNKKMYLVVLVKKSIYHVTKHIKRLFFQLLVSFDFLKSILDDVIVDINIIFGFGLKT